MKEYSFESISVGTIEEFDVVVTDVMMDAFLSASGDVNPLHIDPEYARTKGFPDRVVYGMLTASLYSRLAGVYLPGKNCLLHGLDISFLTPVFVGDSLKVRGEIVYKNDAYRIIEMKAWIRKEDGTKVSKASIKAGLI